MRENDFNLFFNSTIYKYSERLIKHHLFSGLKTSLLLEPWNKTALHVGYKALQVEKLITEKSKLRDHIIKGITQIMGNKNYPPKPSGLFAIENGNPHAMVTLTL